MLRPRLTLHVLSYSPLQFGWLERVEVGGTKGKALTNAIKQVHADFLAAHGRFQEVSCVAELLAAKADFVRAGVQPGWRPLVADRSSVCA